MVLYETKVTMIAMTTVKNIFPYVLFSIHLVLLLWGLAGLAEYLFAGFETGLQNTNFPKGTQLLHWLLLIISGAVYTVGFLIRSKHTPFITIIMYAMLATLCFIETVDFKAFGDTATRYIPMTLEFIAYIALSIYLSRSMAINERFNA